MKKKVLIIIGIVLLVVIVGSIGTFTFINSKKLKISFKDNIEINIREEDLKTLRPGDGLSPMLWDKVVGSKAIKDFEVNQKIEL